MSMMMITSINTYTKSMEMKMKWQKKQTSGDYKADGKTSIESTAQRQLEDIRESQKDGSKQMAAQIELKMMSGKRLSAEEMEYLKEHDPETYKKAKALEMEREAYERELKNCKTKEEVQRVKAAHAAAALDRVNDIKNNPNIPGGKKLELIKQEHAKATALDDTMNTFTKSGEYQKLPTEAERQKAEKEMEEAKKAEMGLDEESRKKAQEEKKAEESASESGKLEDGALPEKTPEDRVSENGALQEKAPEHGTLSERTPREGVSRSGHTGNQVTRAEGRVFPKEESSIRKTLLDEEAREARKVITERTKTRAQAEVTPEARKVRQARAKAAYSSNQPRMVDAEVPTIDIKK